MKVQSYLGWKIYYLNTISLQLNKEYIISPIVTVFDTSQTKGYPDP